MLREILAYNTDCMQASAVTRLYLGRRKDSFVNGIIVGEIRCPPYAAFS